MIEVVVVHGFPTPTFQGWLKCQGCEVFSESMPHLEDLLQSGDGEAIVYTPKKLYDLTTLPEFTRSHVFYYTPWCLIRYALTKGKLVWKSKDMGRWVSWMTCHFRPLSNLSDSNGGAREFDAKTFDFFSREDFLSMMALFRSKTLRKRIHAWIEDWLGDLDSAKICLKKRYEGIPLVS